MLYFILIYYSKSINKLSNYLKKSAMSILEKKKSGRCIILVKRKKLR